MPHLHNPQIKWHLAIINSLRGMALLTKGRSWATLTNQELAHELIMHLSAQF